MHHLKVFFWWNLNKKPIDICENDGAKDNPENQRLEPG